MPNPFYICPRSEFDTLGESRDHALAVAAASRLLGRVCLVLSGTEAGLAVLFAAPNVLSSDEGMPLPAILGGVSAGMLALGSRLGFVVRKRALMRATELPHEFSDARTAELAALAATRPEQPANIPEVFSPAMSPSEGQQQPVSPDDQTPEASPPSPPASAHGDQA